MVLWINIQQIDSTQTLNSRPAFLPSWRLLSSPKRIHV
nr:MAG TPA: hypothetical protein [Caudoviricetes sp.]